MKKVLEFILISGVTVLSVLCAVAALYTMYDIK